MRGRGTTVAVSVLLTLASAGRAAAEAWVEVRSPSFAVVSDGSEKDARQVAQQFEQVRALLQEVWPWARVDTVRPVTILAVRDEGGLRALLPAFWEKKGSIHPAGVFVSAPDRSWVALRMDVARFREGDETWDNPYLVVFHEYVHLVLRLNFGSLPAWLNEGLAEFWGNTIIDGERVYEGRHVPYHLQTLRQRPALPLAALFAVEHGSREASDHDRATIFYAESWALVHYLVVGSEARRGQINRFASLLQSGRPAADAAREAFGDIEALDRELRSYVRQPAFRYRRRMARLEAKEGSWAARRLPEADSLALRAAFHVATDRGPDARDLAGRALELDPGAATAHEALGLLAWRDGRKSDALEALTRATALPSASDFAHYLYGHLLWESLTGSDGLDRVEESYRRAVHLNTSFAAAYASLARVMAERGAPLEKTLPLAVRAARLEPAEIEHTLTALRLAARSGDVKAARAQAEALLAKAEGKDREKLEALVRQLTDAPQLLSPEAGCAAGQAAACAELGARHQQGKDRPRDPALSAAYFEQACKGGDAASCAALGWALERGEGVAKDLPRAVSLYRAGCEGADRWSCTRLAFALVSGDGVEARPAEAARLFEGACAAGEGDACARLGAMLRLGEGVAKDEKRAEAVLTTACDGGSSWACGELGVLFASRGTPESLRRAASTLENACEKGSAGSCAILASLVETGRGVPRDAARADALRKKACDGGYAGACARAGAP
jgi:TPR repeat protein